MLDVLISLFYLHRIKSSSGERLVLILPPLQLGASIYIVFSYASFNAHRVPACSILITIIGLRNLARSVNTTKIGVGAKLPLQR